MDVDAEGLPRMLVAGRSELWLAPDAGVVTWRSRDRDDLVLVGPSAPGAAVGFVGVRPRAARGGDVALTTLTTTTGAVEVLDGLVDAAEPVGRAVPGVALARLVRSLEGALDLLHRVSLADGSSRPVAWTPLNRLALGYVGGRKVTVDPGDTAVEAHAVISRLRAPARRWVPLTIAVDGHLPAEADTCRRLLRMADGLIP